MASRFSITTDKVGLAPGQPVFTGERRVDEVTIEWVRYDADSVDEGEAGSVSEIPAPDPSASNVLWVNVDGLHDVELVQAVGERFGLHPLAIEDILNVRGRPTAEDFDGHLFTSCKMLRATQDGSLDSEHVSIAFGPGWVLSFQETHGDCLDNVRTRITNPSARIRTRGADYLWYALLDGIVDHYAVALSALGLRIEDLEEEVWREEPDRDLALRGQEARHDLLVVRRAVRPLREQLLLLTGDGPALISDQTEPYLGDLEAHLLQHNDVIDHLRDTITSLLEAHVSVISMRTNEVMRVLTIMASIFIPMTFVAGVYGMNFRYMPELQEPWAYPVVWAVMLAIGLSMLLYFWRKKWL
jgi:magnesium transporter